MLYAMDIRGVVDKDATHRALCMDAVTTGLDHCRNHTALRFRSVCCTLFLGFILGACHPPPRTLPADLDRPPTQKDGIDPLRLETAIHDAVAAIRRQHRLRALQLDAPLARLARTHSADMAARNFFGHDSPEGKTPHRRARDAGVRCTVGENLFFSYAYRSYESVYEGPNVETRYTWKTEREMAEEAVVAWLSSPSHRATLLRRDFSWHGIGVALSEGLRVYVTQNLC